MYPQRNPTVKANTMSRRLIWCEAGGEARCEDEPKPNHSVQDVERPLFPWMLCVE